MKKMMNMIIMMKDMMKKNKQELNTAVKVTFKDGSIQEYSSLEEASKGTGLSETAIKIRCNKSRQGSENKKDKIHCMWIDDYTFRSFQAKKSKSKGSKFEYDVIKDLTNLGFEGLQTSRGESKTLDNKKIDVYDSNNVLDFYIQCKHTTNTPSIVKLNNEVGLKDKPLAIFWKAAGEIDKEFVIIPKEYFYKLIKK